MVPCTCPIIASIHEPESQMILKDVIRNKMRHVPVKLHGENKPEKVSSYSSGY